MSSSFEVLGLTEATDAATVKRAYAALLKRFRPDEDPVGFQRLNDAYKACLHQLAFSLERVDADVPPANTLLSEHQQQEPLPDAQDPGVDHGLQGADDDGYRLLEQVHAKAMDLPVHELQGWLQQQDDWYSLRRRRELAPALVQQLLEEGPLPPEQLQAVLQFFHLDALPPDRFWLQHQVAVLRSHAEDAFPEEEGGYASQHGPYAESQQSDGPMIAIMLKILLFIIFAGGLRHCSTEMF